MAARIDKDTFNPRHVRRYFTRTLVLSCGLVAISALNYAFDQQGFNSTQAMDAFEREFGKCNKKGKCTIPAFFLSLLNSLVYIGFAFGAVIGSLISARFGRRMTIFTMSLWALVPATILVTSGVSGNKWQLLVGRTLNYIYIGMELSSVPVYQSEVTPAPIRGLMIGSYQLSLGIGAVIINSICRGTSTIQNNNAWMIPYGLFYIIPTFVASCIWFIPESPRWLLLRGRDDDALHSLRRLRGTGHDIPVEEELALIRQSLREEIDHGTYADLFRGHNRRRTLVVIGVAFFSQATGQVFSGHYGTVFIKSLGTVNPFSIAVSESALNTITSFCGILMIDRVGRRPLWHFGSLGLMVVMMIMGGLGVQTPVSYARSQGIVAMFLIYQMIYVATIAPLYYTLLAETGAMRLRDKTVRIGALVNIVTVFVVSFTVPYFLDAPYADLGSKVGFIYGGMSLLSAMFGYLFLPELKGRSLEELEYMFAQGVPLRKFGSYRSNGRGPGPRMMELERENSSDEPVKNEIAGRTEKGSRAEEEKERDGRA